MQSRVWRSGHSCETWAFTACLPDVFYWTNSAGQKLLYKIPTVVSYWIFLSSGKMVIWFETVVNWPPVWPNGCVACTTWPHCMTAVCLWPRDCVTVPPRDCVNVPLCDCVTALPLSLTVGFPELNWFVPTWACDCLTVCAPTLAPQLAKRQCRQTNDYGG